MTPEQYDDHLLRTTARHQALSAPPVLPLFCESLKLMTLTHGVALARLRESQDTIAALYAESVKLRHLADMRGRLLDIHIGRWAKVPPNQRPHLTPKQRFDALRIAALYPLTVSQLAALICVSVSAIFGWRSKVVHNPVTDEEGYVGSLLQSVPPIHRIDDPTRELIREMDRAGFGGNQKIAQSLARAGLEVSIRSISRIRKEPSLKPPETPLPAPATPTPVPAAPPRQLRARRPLHVALADITSLPSLFGLAPMKLVVILDLFSRFPLAFTVFLQEPTAAEVRALFDAAIAAHGHIDHLVTDQGSQFVAKEVRDALNAHRTRQRFGAIGHYGSIAIIERFWLSLKQLLFHPLYSQLVVRDWEEVIGVALDWYAHHRPHSALGGATPYEVFSGASPKHLEARSPPRGRPGEPAAPSPFVVQRLDPRLPLPILVPAA